MSAAQGSVDNDTTPVRDGHGFDQQRLCAWLEEHVAGFAGPLSVSQFKGGQSNPTYQLKTPQQTYVMRRKPAGTLLKEAHAIEREAQALMGLEKVGYPAAHVYGLCLDESVIGTRFYVMQFVRGRIFWDATLPQIPREQRPWYYDAMNAALAALHRLDYGAAGLADFGRPGNYFERQIARFTKQYLEDEHAGRNPDMDSLIKSLPARIPPGDETCLVHGDFRIDNMIFDPEQPKISAVLDWELSTLGHPLADFSYHAMMYRMPPNIVAGLAGADLPALNIPSEAEYVAAYCRRTDRASIPDYAFYMAFNFFRMAAIFHGIKGRVLRGTAASTQAAERAAHFPTLAALARHALEEC